jgi:undecaprenyl pyrophosphate phosphatase UppP
MKAFRIILAIILIFYAIPTVLSAMDIYKGTEPDLSSEWVVVGVFIALGVLLAAITIIESIKNPK